MTQTCLHPDLEADFGGLDCPHCSRHYTPKQINEATEHWVWTGVLVCTRCNGSFEWTRGKCVFYQAKPVKVN